MSEHDQQAALISWFRLQYPQYKDCLFSIPNGTHLAGTPGQRAAKMNKLKKEGFKNGVSDLFLAVPKNGMAGLWIEMKDEGKKESSVSENQKAHIGLMILMGYSAIWASGFDIAKAAVETYMGSSVK